MTGSDSAPFHVGLNRELVLDAALALTAEAHLFSWSIRDLTARLGVAQSAIYHHVGGKDLLCRGVVERVLTTIETPCPDLEWQDWFRQILYGLFPLLSRYPGVAKWTLMHGPTIPAMIPIIAAGVEKLRQAGFGDDATRTYALLFNTAVLTLSMTDERLAHEGDGPRDHASMMAEFEQMTLDSDDMQQEWESFIRPFATGPESAARAREDYFRFAVDTAITGLATRLDQRPEGRGGGEP